MMLKCKCGWSGWIAAGWTLRVVSGRWGECVSHTLTVLDRTQA